MRTIVTITLFLAITLNACRKKNDVGDNPLRNNIGYLLNQIIEGKDTITFQYDNSNKLAGLIHAGTSFNYHGIYQFFKYNSTGELVSFMYTYRGSDTLSNSHNFSYQGDTIIETSINLNASYGDAIKFFLLNDRIIGTQTGAISNGFLTGFRDTTHYLYQGDNLIKCVSPFLTSTFQPVDSFLYANSFYNPYSLLQKHVWSLITGPGRGLAYAESKNIPSIMIYAHYNVIGTTLISSGFSSVKVTSIESASENNLLPKVIKYLAADGSQAISQYFYQKQK